MTSADGRVAVSDVIPAPYGHIFSCQYQYFNEMQAHIVKDAIESDVSNMRFKMIFITLRSVLFCRIILL